jgi:hypothetical protein
MGEAPTFTKMIQPPSPPHPQKKKTRNAFIHSNMMMNDMCVVLVGSGGEVVFSPRHSQPLQIEPSLSLSLSHILSLSHTTCTHRVMFVRDKGSDY